MNLTKTGVGLNLRLDYIDKFIEQKPKLPFLEVIADNWLTDGPHHKKLEKLRQDYEISFHCVGMNLGGKDGMNKKYLSSIKSLKDKYDPFQISDHVCFQKDNGVNFHDLLPIPFTDNSLLNIADRVLIAQDIFVESILLENLSYYVEYNSSSLSEAEFINSLVRKTGASILLDLNNLLVNEYNLGHNADDFLRAIDWSHVREVHLAGADKQHDVYIDNHGRPPGQELLILATKWIDKLRDLPVMYERDANLPEFNALLDEVASLSRELRHE